jgi:hypothetical protein
VKPESIIQSEEMIKRRRRVGPFVDQKFQPGGWEPFGRAKFNGDPSRKWSFYYMSEGARREMHREYSFEAIAFGVIVIMSAWPLVGLVLMLMQIIR